jgi:Gamma-glutamyl cyclotransferase, AIG2-like
MHTPTEYIFSYGTLQLEAVQMATFGRTLTGTRDVLPGFEEQPVEIDDPTTVSLSGKTHHAIAKFTGRSSDTISGTVYEVTPEEVESADKYEVAAYKRVSVLLGSGVRAWVYVDARFAPPTA